MSLVLCAVDSSLPAAHPHPQLLFISIFACAREARILLLAGPEGSEALPGSQALAPFGSMMVCMCGLLSEMAQGSNCQIHALVLPLKLTLDLRLVTSSLWASVSSSVQEGLAVNLPGVLDVKTWEIYELLTLEQSRRSPKESCSLLSPALVWASTETSGVALLSWEGRQKA